MLGKTRSQPVQKLTLATAPPSPRPRNAHLVVLHLRKLIFSVTTLQKAIQVLRWLSFHTKRSYLFKVVTQ